MAVGPALRREVVVGRLGGVLVTRDLKEFPPSPGTNVYFESLYHCDVCGVDSIPLPSEKWPSQTRACIMQTCRYPDVKGIKESWYDIFGWPSPRETSRLVKVVITERNCLVYPSDRTPLPDSSLQDAVTLDLEELSRLVSPAA
jgi:hypothetical protein